jgi:hypothetical protein
MRRLVLTIVLASLALPSAAFGKELQSIGICGASGCTTLTHEQSAPFIALFERTNEREATRAVLGAVPIGPYYRLAFTLRGDRTHRFSFSMWFVRPNLIRQQSAPDTFPEPFLRVADNFARELDGVASRIEPYSAPRVVSATVNGKRVADAAPYLGLFGALPSVAANANDSDAGAWVHISLVPGRANPWFVRGMEFTYRTRSQALFVNEPLHVPDRLADRIAADAGLPGRDRGSSAWGRPLGMGLAVGALAVGAALFRTVRRRRGASGH